MPIEDNKLNVVAVGASAGGVEALTRFVAGLQPEFPYAVLVVLHLPTRAPSVLARILDRSGPLPATEASDGSALAPGTIRVAVPDRHLLVCGQRVTLSEGPTENGHRPAINSLFRSVAVSLGNRAVSVLLSGPAYSTTARSDRRLSGCAGGRRSPNRPPTRCSPRCHTTRSKPA